MILLHHNESELSRALLAALPDGATSIDCTGGIPADYTGPQPSAYPSVVVDIPAKEFQSPQYDVDGGLLGITTTGSPEHEEIIRLPASWEAVNSYVVWASGGE